MKKNKKIFDPIIFRHALKNIVIQPLYWAVLAVASIILLAFGIAILVSNMGNTMYMFFGFAWFVALFTMHAYEFNYNFVIDRQAEVLNMELRKGRNTKQIFVSRLLASFVFSMAQILIVASILMIVAGFTNPGVVAHFIILPLFVFLLNIVGWGVYLFVFSWGYNKFATFCWQICFILTAASIYVGIPQSSFLTTEQKELTNALSIRKSIITDETLKLYDENNSFAKELFTNGDFLTNFVQNSVPTFATQIDALINLFPSIGIVHESDLNQLLPDTASLDPDYKSTKIYEINDALISNDSLSRNYQQTIYNKSQDTKSAANFTLSELDKTINIINEKYKTSDNNIVAFNKFVREFGKSEITKSRAEIKMTYEYSFRQISDSVVATTETLNELNNSIITSNQEESDFTIHTPVGLKFWNEVVLKMYYLASNVKEINTSAAGGVGVLKASTYLIPGRMTHEMILHPNQYVNFLTYNVPANFNGFVIIDNDEEPISGTLAWYYKGNTLYNSATNEYYGKINVVKSSNKKVYGMGFSYIGYSVFLMLTAAALLIASWKVFDKKTWK